MTMTTTIQKSVALAAINANREAHIKMCMEAREGYKQKATERLHKMLAKVAEGSIENLRFDLNPPVEYTRVYDAAIGQLRAHEGDTLTIDTTTYSELIDDNWDWSHIFAHHNSSYSSSTLNWARGKGL